jgi:hypothetical protein
MVRDNGRGNMNKMNTINSKNPNPDILMTIGQPPRISIPRMKYLME